jgi:hypothetical protein
MGPLTNSRVGLSTVMTLSIAAGTILLISILFVQQQAWAQISNSPTGTLDVGAQQQKVTQQGVATSSPDPLPGHEAHQSATILRLRNDNAVYSGILTFTATKPVEVQVLHRNMTTSNISTGIPEAFGALSQLQIPGGTITISNIIPQFPEDSTAFVASLPFSGNAIALHNIEGEPFAATYTVTADVVGAAKRVDDIGPAPPEPPAAEDEEDEE